MALNSYYKHCLMSRKKSKDTLILDIDDQNVQMYGFASKSTKLHV